MSKVLKAEGHAIDPSWDNPFRLYRVGYAKVPAGVDAGGHFALDKALPIVRCTMIARNFFTTALFRWRAVALLRLPQCARYDISDYTTIDPQYSTMADFDRLVSEAGKRHIRVSRTSC